MTTILEQASPQSPEATPARKFRLRGISAWTIRVLLGIVFSFPLLFMFVSSLKPDAQIFGDLSSMAAFLPVGDLSTENYQAVFERVPAARFLINSIAISAVTVALGVLINSLAAFALSRLQMRGKGIILTLIIATLIVPFETLALPLVWWVNKLPWLEINGFSLSLTTGWLDTYQVQIIPFVANAFSIYLFHQYFESIPKELDEAARVDGAGWFKIYSRIIMPLSGPAIATVSILTFLPAWNSYLWPLMVVQSEELRPVMVGVQYFFQLNVSWGEIMAYSSMITLPVVALFIAFQRSFVNSIASSGVKGSEALRDLSRARQQASNKELAHAKQRVNATHVAPGPTTTARSRIGPAPIWSGCTGSTSGSRPPELTLRGRPGAGRDAQGSPQAPGNANHRADRRLRVQGSHQRPDVLPRHRHHHRLRAGRGDRGLDPVHRFQHRIVRRAGALRALIGKHPKPGLNHQGREFLCPAPARGREPAHPSHRIPDIAGNIQPP